MAQLVRAPPCHGGGRGFESHSGRLQETLSVDCLIKLSWDHSSAGRASALQAEGHRFEPYCSHQYGLVVQLVRAPPCHGGGRGFESRLGRSIWDLSSAGRASALQAEGHRFEPYRSHLYADVAQLAEQLICNQQVNGSSPFIGLLWLLKVIIKYGWIPEWPKGTDCKSAANCFGGSNPPLPILLRPTLCRSFFVQIIKK